MTPLRKKMIRAMELRNLSHHTQRSYLTAVKGLSRHYQKSPDKLTKEMVEDYLLYLKKDKGNALGSCCSVFTGLKFFYNNVAAEQIRIEYSGGKKAKKLPEVLTQEEIWDIIEAQKNFQHPVTRLCRRLAQKTFSTERDNAMTFLDIYNDSGYMGYELLHLTTCVEQSKRPFSLL